jgi:hypothetical protein
VLVVPGQVTGSRTEDDERLRRQVLLAARWAAAAGAVTLAAGFLPAVRDGHTAGTSGAAASVVPVSATPSRPPAVHVSPKGTATSPVAWQVRPTGNRAKDAALAGYERYFATAVRLGEEPDPADAALPEVAVEPELSRLRRSLSVSSDAQISQRGRLLVVAWVATLRGSQAQVMSCTNWRWQRRYDPAGRPMAWHAGITAAAAWLRWDGQEWRVYRFGPQPASRCHR